MRTIEKIKQKRIQPSKFFAMVVLAIGTFSFLFHLLFPEYRFYSFYFYDTNDSFMDFYHSITFSASDNPYDFELIGAIYPPFCYLLFSCLSRFLDPSVLTDAFVMRNDQIGRMLLLVCTMVLISMLVATIYSRLSAPKWQKCVIVSMVILSYPILYLLERANILLLSIICLLYYVLNYDSENKIEQELSLLLLAVAAAIKIYPAIFGVLLFFEEKRDYKKIIRCVAYGIILFFAPFFYYEGIPTFFQFIENLMDGVKDTPLHSGSVLVRVDLATICYAIGIVVDNWFSTGTFQENIIIFTQLVQFVFGVVLAVGIIVQQEKWKKVLYFSVLTLVIPPFSYTYCLTVFLCPLIALLQEKNISLRDIPYLIYFSLVFVVSPLSTNPKNLLMLAALYCLIILDIMSSVLVWFYNKTRKPGELENLNRMKK